MIDSSLIYRAKTLKTNTFRKKQTEFRAKVNIISKGKVIPVQAVEALRVAGG
jgi:hypothetical protein